MRKSLTIITLAFLACAAVYFAPSCSETENGAIGTTENTANALAVLDDTISPYAIPADTPLDSMPDDGCIKLRVCPPPGYLAKVFNDSNYLHYEAAEHLGIDPITAENLNAEPRRPLHRIMSCRQFYVADLSHSYPFLVPEASKLLHEIGQAFNDTLQARGGGDYRLKVTSLLRTNCSIHRLRRVNRCAVDSSAHRFGTTFDISYTRFMLTDTGGVYRTQEDLKNLLAEIIWSYRQQGRCYVKYERKSGCFHITTRPLPNDKKI